VFLAPESTKVGQNLFAELRATVELILIGFRAPMDGLDVAPWTLYFHFAPEDGNSLQRIRSYQSTWNKPSRAVAPER
jgi:hypothetical protein